MDVILRYRGREVTDEDAAFIRALIAANPEAHRYALSVKLCEAWNWVQPNGSLKDMVCRGLMLQLHRAGHIELPAPRKSNGNAYSRRRKPTPPKDLDQTPLQGSVSELRPLEWRQVRHTREDALWGGLIEAYHYLGYTRPVGEHLKYIVYAQGRPIACSAWCSSARNLGCRDHYIGWDAQTRWRNIRFLAYNTRFLILPWVRVPYLASHILGHTTRRLSRDWEQLYRHRIHFVETIVDPDRFRGTCYRAANWIPLGLTKGRGLIDKSHSPNRSLKEVFGYPLTKRFREALCSKEAD